ncbi:MAG: hydrogenase iron-sulfur subunit [Candidatus Zipacnadales bacterium]
MSTEIEWQPRLLVFLCNWSLYAPSDREEVERAAENPNIRVIRVPCSGRVNPLFILNALQNGRDGVLVVGCNPGQCHYKEGNYLSERKLITLRRFLEYVGIEPERIQFAWVNEAERHQFPRLIQSMTESLSQLGQSQRFRRVC